MIPGLQARFHAMPKWTQYLLLILAGGVSFAVSFGMGNHDAKVPTKTQTTPSKVSVNRTAAASDAAEAASPSAVPASGAASTNINTVSRLDAHVVRNPFAPLNLATGPATPAPPQAPAPKPEKKKPAPPPPPPPPPVNPVPVVPTAPPLPFVVMGSIRGAGIADGKPIVFLNEKGATLTVSAGDEIRGTYKVEQISATAIEFTYLPLNQRQSLPLSN